jgi:hypothetical protein
MRRCVIAWHQLFGTRPSLIRVRPSKNGGVIPYTQRGEIPYSEIIAWAKQNRIDREFTELLIDVIARLDNDRSEAIASKESLS